VSFQLSSATKPKKNENTNNDYIQVTKINGLVKRSLPRNISSIGVGATLCRDTHQPTDNVSVWQNFLNSQNTTTKAKIHTKKTFCHFAISRECGKDKRGHASVRVLAVNRNLDRVRVKNNQIRHPKRVTHVSRNAIAAISGSVALRLLRGKTGKIFRHGLQNYIKMKQTVPYLFL
jgi:hypothetical protein